MKTGSDMENKPKIGDYVRMKRFPYEGKICRITGIEGNAYWIDGYTLCTEVHFEPISARSAFVSELKDLLGKYDAEIVAFIGEDDATHKDKPLMYIEFDKNVLNFENYESEPECCVINADNIMDYKKD